MNNGRPSAGGFVLKSLSGRGLDCCGWKLGLLTNWKLGLVMGGKLELVLEWELGSVMNE